VITDRERVERALVPRVFRRVLMSMKGRGFEDDQGIYAALNAACLEPIEDLSIEKKLVIARRVDRVQEQLLKEYEGRSAATVLVALTYWVNEEMEAGRIYINPESPAWAAITAMVDVLNDTPEVLEMVRRSGERNGKWIGEKFRKLGYFTR